MSAKQTRPPSAEQKAMVALVRRLMKTHTLEELAGKLDVAFASVSRWNRGTTLPYRNVARRLLPTLQALDSGNAAST